MFGPEHTKTNFDNARTLIKHFRMIPGSGKIPLVKWQHIVEGEHNTTEKQMQHWLATTNPDNWLALCGNGVIVLDADDKEAIALVEQRCPATPAVVSTPSGGRHYYYRGSVFRNRGTVTIKGHKYRLDRRGLGGYVVAPGSILPRGTYEAGDLEEFLTAFKNAPLYSDAWFPEWLPGAAGMVTSDLEGFADECEVPLAERRQRARRKLDGTGGAVQGRGADGYCLALAHEVTGGFLLPEKIAVEELYRWGTKPGNVDRNGDFYPWSEQEIEHKVRSAIAQGYRGKPGDKLFELENADKMQTMERKAAKEIKPQCMTFEEETPDFEEMLKIEPKPKRFYFKTFEELGELPALEWQIKPLFHMGSVVWLVGASFCGKSYIALDWCMCIATGMPYQGRYNVKKGSVAYICAEGARGFRQRMAAWGAYYKRSIPDTFKVMPNSTNLVDAFSVDEITKALEREYPDGLDMVVIDTLARNIAGADDSSARDMGVFQGNVDKIKDRFGCTVLILHHTGHNGGRERGSTAIRGAADTTILVERSKDRAIVSCEKQKDGEQFEQYHLKAHPVGESLVTVRLSASEDQELGDAAANTYEKLVKEYGDRTWKWEEARILLDIPKSTMSRHVAKLVETGKIARNETGSFGFPK